MNTTIIIALGALILIVVIAIIVILIKGKDPDEVEGSDTQGKSFQEDSLKPPKDFSNGKEVTTPQLHKKENSSHPPATKPPVMNNLTTPQETPSAQTPPISNPMEKEEVTPETESNINPPTETLTQNTVNLGQDMYKSNPLPDNSKINSDLENLQKSSQNHTPTQPTTTAPQETPSTEPSQGEKLNDITNDINNVLATEGGSTSTTPNSVQAPTATKDPLENKMPQASQPNPVTQNSEQPKVETQKTESKPVTPSTLNTSGESLESKMPQAQPVNNQVNTAPISQPSTVSQNSTNDTVENKTPPAPPITPDNVTPEPEESGTVPVNPPVQPPQPTNI